MAKLTQQLVERATGPATGQRFLRDTRVAGLALRVTSGGAKAWVWEGRVRGRVRRITLGPYPALSLAQAREQGLGVAGAVALVAAAGSPRITEAYEQAGWPVIRAAWAVRSPRLEKAQEDEGRT